MHRDASVARRALCLVLLLLCCGLARGDSGVSWWDRRWAYRLIVAVVPQAQRGGINVARINLAEQSELCQPDGRDVRVLDARGRMVPHEVRLKDNKTLDVLFFTPPDCESFHIYYGNPEAPVVELEGPPRKLGGLTLETRPIATAISQASQIRQWLQKFTSRFDKQPWGQIHDVENPFGRDDLYLSIYEGVIYCPEDGEYVFAVNADDVASFEIEGVAGPLCWRDAGTPPRQWQDPRNPRATARVRLRKGIYHFHYYHAENGGTQLAVLGWKRPSSEAIVTVPPEAFVIYLPAEIVGRQRLGQQIAPFFVARHSYNLVVNALDFGFPSYRFESRSLLPASDQTEWTYHWDFGDGTTDCGKVVSHEFGAPKTYTVSLTVSDRRGRQATIARPISPPARPLKRMMLQMEVESQKQTIAAGTPARVNVFIGSSSSVKRPLVLESVIESWGGGAGERQSHQQLIEIPGPASPHEGAWLRLSRHLPPSQDNMYLSLRLKMYGSVVAERRVAALRTDRPLGALRLGPGQQLQDEEGRLVVLVLADVKADSVEHRRLCEPQSGKVTVAVCDDALAGPPNTEERGSYITLLRHLLNRTYEGLNFQTIRCSATDAKPYLPLSRFVETYRKLIRLKPNLVLLACQPQAPVNGVPLEAFEDCLVATVDQILSQSRAAVVLITPPPLPGLEHMARPYSQAVKRVGLRKGVPVADIYSRFLLREDWQALFEAPAGQRSTLLLTPNREGQQRIAVEIYASIVERLHPEFWAAARKAAYARKVPM